MQPTRGDFFKRKGKVKRVVAELNGGQNQYFQMGGADCQVGPSESPD